MIATEAWVLHQGPNGRNEGHEPGELRREIYFFPDIIETEALVEPIYGGWEANLGHAINRMPVDVCRQRDDEKIVIGNSGVVRVLKVGQSVTHTKEGDYCIINPDGITDQYGYVKKVFAYDAPQTMGLLAKKSKLAARHLIPIPPETKHSLVQWACLGRYASAWSNWQVAYKCLRTQLTKADCPQPYVWGWGGGVSFAELQLARQAGCRTAMIASHPNRLELIKQHGIQPIDRSTFLQLNYDAQRFNSDLDYKAQYLEAEHTFLQQVKEQTDGEGIHIFIDNIGTPVYRATLKALTREAVITTCGWKHGMVVSHLRAVECIERHIHVHTHATTHAEAEAAIQFSEKHGWLPPEAECPIYSWEMIPQLAQDYEAGKIKSYFPLYAVNPL